MDQIDQDRFRRGILREVCRRIGHDWGQTRVIQLADGTGTYSFQSCNTCDADSPPVVTPQPPKGGP